HLVTRARSVEKAYRGGASLRVTDPVTPACSRRASGCRQPSDFAYLRAARRLLWRPGMSRFLPVLFLAACTAGDFQPIVVHCGPNDPSRPGFECEATDHTCVAQGEAAPPDAAVDAPAPPPDAARPAALALAPAKLEVGAVTLGSASQPAAVTATNRGGA